MVMLLPLIWACAEDQKPRLRPSFEPAVRTYNYSPCLVRTGDGALHVWYCANRPPGEVTDYLVHRVGTVSQGRTRWSEETVALRPGLSRSDWDSRHVCDPEVLGGRFRYQGREWRYAMFYLGCDAEYSTHNQVGVAFAERLQGPWRKYPEPIVRYTSDPAAGIVREARGWPVYRFWGVGQPAAISLDRRGKVLLFYSRGEGAWGEEMVEADLSEMDRGPVLGERRPVPAAGLTRGGVEGNVVVNNIGVALDERAGMVYMVREDLPPADGRKPEFIAASVQLARMPWKDLLKGTGRWEVLEDIGESVTGWPRNHNASLLKDLWGRLPEPSRLTIALSLAEAHEHLPPDFDWLWTYRIATLQYQPARRGSFLRPNP